MRGYETSMIRDKVSILLVLASLLPALTAGCSSPANPPVDAAFNHEIQGELYSRQGQYPAALQEYQSAIYLNPNSWPAHEKAGHILEQQGKFQEAIAQYRKVIAINYTVRNPADKAWWYFHLAGALSKVGSAQEAANEYRTAYIFASHDQTHSKKLVSLARKSFFLSQVH